MSAVLPPVPSPAPAAPGKSATPQGADAANPFAALLAMLGAGVVPAVPVPAAPTAAPPVVLPATPPLNSALTEPVPAEPVVPGAPAPAPAAEAPAAPSLPAAPVVPPAAAEPQDGVTALLTPIRSQTAVTRDPKGPKAPKHTAEAPAAPIPHPSQRRSPEPAAAPAEPARPATPAQPKADVPATPGTPATPTAPAAIHAPAEPRHETPHVREVPLPRAPHAVGQLIHLAQVKGVSHARLNLRPAELGGIEVRLASDAGGLTATVVADKPEAAALLQSAADDLRRQLERNGVTVSSIEISTAEAGTTSAGSGDAQPRGQAERGTPGSGTPQGDADPEPESQQTLTLPDGVLVDVLA